VAFITDKQEPTGDEIAKNFNQTRESQLEQRREEAFAVFITTLQEKYQKEGRIRMSRAAQSPLGGRSPI
jgi:peptidyl-prolyl cis-trans isomerase D